MFMCSVFYPAGRHQESNAAGKLVKCASLSISSNCTLKKHLRCSGRKRKLSFGSWFCSFEKNDCSKDKKITASAHLTFLECGEDSRREEHVNFWSVCSVYFVYVYIL